MPVLVAVAVPMVLRMQHAVAAAVQDSRGLSHMAIAARNAHVALRRLLAACLEPPTYPSVRKSVSDQIAHLTGLGGLPLVAVRTLMDQASPRTQGGRSLAAGRTAGAVELAAAQAHAP